MLRAGFVRFLTFAGWRLLYPIVMAATLLLASQRDWSQLLQPLLALDVVAPLGLPEFYVTLLNYIGLSAWWRSVSCC
jgi:hypothetical protein